ncbi:TetR/AcrR family transcriptional regulator [Hydrogenophaga sp. BPS33]|uniref:TetR/AcrR family transcriptional regulator n=1 Tax=Hydrogenophaga sp. BPS33 TaxID=2651974 RepID=UPI00131F74EE|nr:TetR/AcrR family transcriptional regulator [Hydrogenophaga sp. BPS33]QHE86799.1 TetR/AcrR family transcriptional regulator [Hydrogenophaga sp. BPS33]
MPKTTAAPATRQPRRTQAERTQATQRKLIDCAIDLLKEKRYASFRTAEVAERAGVSKGAQTHHFPSKDMLVLQALEEVYKDTMERAMARIDAARQNPRQLLALLVADSREFFLGDDFLLSLDLMMVDPGSSLGADVKRLAQQYRLPVEQAWLEAFVAAGHPARQAKDVVRLSFAVARGFGIRQLVAGPDEEFDALFQTWTRMAEAMLLLSSPSGPP